jgi:hypothetical protein
MPGRGLIGLHAGGATAPPAAAAPIGQTAIASPVRRG